MFPQAKKESQNPKVLTLQNIQNTAISSRFQPLLLHPCYQSYQLDVSFCGNMSSQLKTAKTLCFYCVDVHSDFSINDSRLGYFIFSLLRTVFFAFSMLAIFGLYDITSMLFFNLHRLKYFLGYNGRIVALS